MAAPTQANQFQFMVYCPDKTDDGAFQRRLSVREKHLENAKVLGDNGTLKFGRAIMSPESIASPGAEQKMVGSMMVYQAASLEEAKKIVESDIYYTSGVWDPERVVVLPFMGLPM
ncbi:uncharacterized protein FOMMEDRAFT_165059 [Fomitiporia mediterranea MF3/22]|uniref:uncharacterized protein n=1 Tax=Fomitiporia mediterranea (strain MF3/22) TaxID=694068 RepID=UPI0004409C14|nr:uncharacterized protein FOMMEDRAFT_165059 [Fomitiporia mediterranea MF3/22]EJD08493.1 hypothetical protein FOMMEDRAFT_165059 [Fomitiporia mediterranea MF3/22]